MQDPVVVYGVGQMGAVLSYAFLRDGRAVYPVTRTMSAAQVAQIVPAPKLVTITVGERDLDSVLGDLPRAWRPCLVLIQNELLPTTWRRYGIEDPTVAVVWFEKKKGSPVRPILETPVGGPNAARVVRALQSIEIPTREVDRDELLVELVRKSLYILVFNSIGLVYGGTVGELAAKRGELVAGVTKEVLTVLEARLSAPLPARDWHALLAEAVDADPEHVGAGRIAAARLGRAIADADGAGLKVPMLRSLLAGANGTSGS